MLFSGFCHSDEETRAFFRFFSGTFLLSTDGRKNKHFLPKKWKMKKYGGREAPAPLGRRRRRRLVALIIRGSFS